MDHKVCTPLFELHPHSVLAHEAIYVNRFHAKMSRLMLCKVFHLRAGQKLEDPGCGKYMSLPDILFLVTNFQMNQLKQMSALN